MVSSQNGSYVLYAIRVSVGKWHRDGKTECNKLNGKFNSFIIYAYAGKLVDSLFSIRTGLNLQEVLRNLMRKSTSEL